MKSLQQRKKQQHSVAKYMFNYVLSHIYVLVYSLEYDDYFVSLFNEFIQSSHLFASYNQAKKESMLEVGHKKEFLIHLQALLTKYSYLEETTTYRVLATLVDLDMMLLESLETQTPVLDDVKQDIKHYLDAPDIKIFLNMKLKQVTTFYAV